MIFEFLVDKENFTLDVRREFKAERQQVWDAYTKSELLDKWFAPKPFSTKTKKMEFKEGGCWHYAMIDPGGTEHWGLTEYVKIQPIEFYSTLDGFADANGILNTSLPRAKWNVTFKNLGKNTLVETKVQYDSFDSLETILKMGMEQGLAATLERLDELLLTLG